MSGKHGRHRGRSSRHADSVVTRAESTLFGESGVMDGGTRTATLERSASVASSFDRTAPDVTVPDVRARDVMAPFVKVTPSSADAIVPASGLGTRRAARLAKQQRRHKQLLAAGGFAVVVALIAWAVIAATGRSAKHTQVAAASHGRTQVTLLVQVKGALGAAVDSALVAHDPAQHSGVVVLVPSSVIAQVPGFGSMPFGQASTLSQADAPRTTLADLIHVDVDGSWVLSTQALAAFVDKVGGVTVTVDKDVTKPGPNGTTTIVVPAGAQKLSGAGAAAFATFLGDGETEQLRLARFDAVFTAVLAALPKQPTEIAKMVAALGTGSSSSFSPARLGDILAGLAADNAANSTADTVLPVKNLDTGDDQLSFSVDASKTAAFVDQHLSQSVPANRKVTDNRVMVENQVGTPGIGETTRQKLNNAGFVYAPGQNAPGMPNATAPSVVLIQGTTAADIAQGDKVAKALGLPTSDVRVSPQRVNVADVIVLIGADYKP